jgi:hypothetical protein
MYDKKITYSYNEMEREAIFTINYGGASFTGKARCHPEDNDFGNERTGLIIAEARANIKLMKFQRRFEIQPKIDVLKHILANMETSKQYAPKSYEAKSIRSQLRAAQEAYDQLTQDIIDEEKSLKEYIDNKTILYTKLRAKSQ